MNEGNIYSASDRAIFDALMQSKVVKDALQELFLKRGIIISRDTDRRQLAMYFSRIQHDYMDYLRLSELLGSISGKEHLGTKYIRNEISVSTMTTIVDSLAYMTEELDVKVFDTTLLGNALHLNISYTVVHFSKSEFRQVVEKDANIVIENNGNGVALRYPVNKKTDAVLDVLFEKVAEYLDAPIDIEVISLESVSDILKRKRFFELLMSGMTGYTMIEVVDAYVYNPSSADPSDSDEVYDQIPTRISKAALKGANVLNSEELKKFLNNGFCITKVVWQSVKNEDDCSDLYEFEAQFKNAEMMSDFNYLVKGYYKYKNSDDYGDKKYLETRSSLNFDGETKLSRLIELSALESMYAVCESIGSVSDAKDEVVQG